MKQLYRRQATAVTFHTEGGPHLMADIFHETLWDTLPSITNVVFSFKRQPSMFLRLNLTINLYLGDE